MLRPDSQVERLSLPEGAGGRVWIYEFSDRKRSFHRHAELELNVALRGHATYIVGDARIRLTRRSLLWLYPAQDHILIEQSCDFSMGIAVWTPAFLKQHCQSATSQMLLRDQPGETLAKRVHESDFAELSALFSRLASANDELRETGLSWLLHLSLECERNGEHSGTPRAVHPSVERAARLLRDQSPPPSVPELSRQVGLSPSRLSRLFKTQTGVALSEFRSQQCHERALALCESDLPLTLVAQRAGFGSYAQFHRTFCARQGRNPARFRRDLKNG